MEIAVRKEEKKKKSKLAKERRIGDVAADLSVSACTR
jgi:hypothetical protein